MARIVPGLQYWITPNDTYPDRLLDKLDEIQRRIIVTPAMIAHTPKSVIIQNTDLVEALRLESERKDKSLKSGEKDLRLGKQI